MKSFLEGKKASSIPALRLPAGMRQAHSSVACSPQGNAASAGQKNGNANVEVVKEGDKVVRLIVTCGCGERVEIDCLYPVGT